MSDPFPTFSIIIPTYNRPDLLKNCLESVAQLDYPRQRFEVFVVDDGTPQPLAHIVDLQRSRINIELLQQSNRGPGSARNAGVARAGGRFLAFLDDDCAPRANWLRVMAGHLSLHPEVMVGGYTLNAYPENMYAGASQMLNNYLFQYYRRRPDRTQKFAASNNMALAARPFRELGGFDVTFANAAGEDRDFCSRWLGQGWELHYLPQAEVRHFQALNAKAFLRQHFSYGQGNYQYHSRRRNRGGGGNRLESWRFYSMLLSAPWQSSSGFRAGYMSFLLFASQAANGLGYFSAKIQDGLGRAFTH